LAKANKDTLKDYREVRLTSTGLRWNMKKWMNNHIILKAAVTINEQPYDTYFPQQFLRRQNRFLTFSSSFFNTCKFTIEKLEFQSKYSIVINSWALPPATTSKLPPLVVWSLAITK
jgi:hypothetical protein